MGDNGSRVLGGQNDSILITYLSILLSPSFPGRPSRLEFEVRRAEASEGCTFRLISHASIPSRIGHGDVSSRIAISIFNNAASVVFAP